MMTCALTGASGYVGSRLAACLAGGGYQVVFLGRKPESSGITWALDSNVRIADALKARSVSALVHSAWDFSLPGASENRRVNLEGSRRLIDDAVAAGVRELVFISTISAFDNARSQYGQTKLAVEQTVLAAGGTVIRPGLVWGEGPGGMFGAMRKQVSSGGLVPTIGDGRYPQYLVHEDDLGAAVVRAVAGAFRGQTLTLAHPHPWLLRDLVLRMAQDQGQTVRLMGMPWRAVFGGLKLAESLGLKLSFRSDSVTSLVFQNPAPDFSSEVPLRAFH